MMVSRSWRVVAGFLLFATAVTVKSVYSGASASKTKPNIVFILADDLGWNDVSFHGSYQIPTPNLDKLAYSGVMLTNYYVLPICTPTRSALMTGRYPIHTGMWHKTVHPSEPWGLGLNETLLPELLKQQGYDTYMIGKVGMWHNTIVASEPWGLGLNETVLPELLKQQGYDTYMVGKWHLGFFEKNYLPSRRGFNFYLGHYTGKENYYTHYNSEVYGGFDFHKNGEIFPAGYGNYSTNVFTQQAEHIIANHNQSKPMFLYLAHQAVHSGNNASFALQAPKEYYDRFPNITEKNRRMFAAMVAVMDESVGNVTRALKQAGLYDNSIIIFSTDNGGPAHGFDFNHANNYPLRGVKHTLWEGGVRGTAFVHSTLLQKPARISHDLLHVCDWMPTIYGLAGGDISKLTNLDGFDVWPTLSMGMKSPRSEILLNIDTLDNVSALRSGDMKIINGDIQLGIWAGWYKPEGLPPHYNPPPPPKGAFQVHCLPKPSNASTNCQPFHATCLYNITNDPCEFYNIAEWNQDIVASMTARLNEYKARMVPNRNKPSDPKANPSLHGGFWVPWVHSNHDNDISDVNFEP